MEESRIAYDEFTGNIFKTVLSSVKFSRGPLCQVLLKYIYIYQVLCPYFNETYEQVIKDSVEDHGVISDETKKYVDQTGLDTNRQDKLWKMIQTHTIFSCSV